MAHPIEVVYAKTTVILKTDDGADVPVGMGTHWPAHDALVKANPDAFTPDPRFGLQFSGDEPPAYMMLPPDAEIPASMLAGGDVDEGDDNDDPTDLGITVAPRAQGRGRRD